MKNTYLLSGFAADCFFNVVLWQPVICGEMWHEIASAVATPYDGRGDSSDGWATE
jgi:hypothetical protein